jgi:hypothetical protein
MIKSLGCIVLCIVVDVIFKFFGIMVDFLLHIFKIDLDVLFGGPTKVKIIVVLAVPVVLPIYINIGCCCILQMEYSMHETFKVGCSGRVG